MMKSTNNQPTGQNMTFYSQQAQSMKTSTVIMTPEQAAALLNLNKTNRKLRKYWVNELTTAIKNGEWKLTHQGVAISKTGRLLDGQHRLKAIAAAGISVPIVVAENCEEETFAFIDKGVKRNIADSLSINNKIAEVVKFTMMLHGCRADRPGLAFAFFDSEIGHAASFLYKHCSASRRVASSAACKAAAAITMIETGKYNEVAENYKNFVQVNYDKMTPSLLLFERQISTGLATSSDKWDAFSRAYKCFSSFESKISMLKLGDSETEAIRSHCRQIISDVVNANTSSF